MLSPEVLLSDCPYPGDKQGRAADLRLGLAQNIPQREPGLPEAHPCAPETPRRKRQDLNFVLSYVGYMRFKRSRKLQRKSLISSFFLFLLIIMI